MINMIQDSVYAYSKFYNLCSLLSFFCSIIYLFQLTIPLNNQKVTFHTLQSKNTECN